MKFIVEVDATPKEVRESLGLPDIQAVQERVIKRIEDKVMDSVESCDPTKLLKTVIPEGLGLLGGLQKTILENLPTGSKNNNKSRSKTSNKSESKKG